MSKIIPASAFSAEPTHAWAAQVNSCNGNPLSFFAASFCLRRSHLSLVESPKIPQISALTQITAAIQLQLSAAVQDGHGTACLERTWVTASLLSEEDGE